MAKWLLRMLGFKMAKRAFAGGRGRAPMIDIGLGFALLRDRRVPVQNKLTALGIGAAAIAVLLAVEAPVELLIAFLLNVPGIGLDLFIDGLEILAGPVLVASLVLPRIVPAHIVEWLRAERGPVPVTHPVRRGRVYSPPNHLS